MDIWSTGKLLLFLAFFIPGFVSIRVYDTLIPSVKREFSKGLFEVLSYSALHYAFLSPLLIMFYRAGFPQQPTVWHALLVLLVLVLIPASWPVLLLKLSSLKPIADRIMHPMPTPWDCVFFARPVFWVIVHLRDGTRIGGKYGGKSFSSSHPHPEQIYLQEVWALDPAGKFLRAVDQSKGIIVFGGEIRAVEFFEPSRGGSNERTRKTS